MTKNRRNQEWKESKSTIRTGGLSKVRFKRRNFLRSSASLGLFGLMGNVQSKPEMERVPKYKRGDVVVKWMSVPKSWLTHNEQAKATLDTLTQSIKDLDGLIETGLVRSESKFGGKNGFDIEVVYNVNKGKPKIPDKVSGITVKLRGIEPSSRSKVKCKNTGDFLNYKGGLNIFDDSPSSTERSVGTSGYRVKYNGSYYMLTASHTFENCSYTVGDITYQENDDLGEIVTGDVSADLVLTDASLDSFVSIVNKVREPDGTTRSISGFASESEIANRVSNSFDGYRKIGIHTGKTTGGLGKKDITVLNDCNSLDGEGVRGSANTAKGDSGGPAYSVEDGDAYMLFHVTDGTGGTDGTTVACDGQVIDVFAKSLGTGAYHVNNLGYKIAV